LKWRIYLGSSDFRMSKKFLSSFFVSVSCFVLVTANPGETQTLTWRNLSSMYNVNALSVTQGKIWAATSGGVFSYSVQDGSFQQFTTTEGLSNIEATSVVSESGNAIIIGEGNGAIDELDATTGKVLRTQHDIVNSSPTFKAITKLSIYGDTVFACTPFGVVLISRSTFNTLNSYLHFVPGQNSVQANDVVTFNNKIFVASSYGLSVAPQSGINLSAPDLWQVNSNFSNGIAVNALATFNGILMVGTNQGLYYSNDGTTFQLFAALGNAYVKTLSVGGSSLLINSRSGLFRLDVSNSLNNIYNNGDSANDVVEYSDTLIFEATGNGLLRIGRTVSRILPPGPATNIITNLSVDENGNLWCSTSIRDVGTAFMKYNYATNSWRNYSMAQDTILPCNNFFSISAVCGGRVVAGAWGGLAPLKNGYHGAMVLLEGDSIVKVFNGSNSTLVGFSGDPTAILVGAAVCDQSGNIWVVNKGAYNNNMLDEYSPETGRWQAFPNNITSDAGFNSLVIDGYGGLWSGDQYGDGTTYHGLFYFDPATKGSALFTTDDGLLNNQVNALLVDAENQLWVGTSGGLNVIYDPSNPGVSTIYSMLDQNITGIDYDALNNKWITTPSGVFEISTDGITLLAQYNTANSPLPSNSVNAVACDRIHGIVYFATPYGVTQLRTGIVKPLDSFAKLRIFPNPAKFPIDKQIQIVGLVANSSIKIFSVSGRLVKEFQAQGGNIAYWDGTGDDGKLVPSGIYIVLAYSSDGSQSVVGKIAVVHR
jgi:ligand-binding sensor domain-containing protein